MFDKSKKTSNEVMMADGYVAVYRNTQDLFFYVVGSVDENELMLASVLNAYHDALSTLLKQQVEKRVLLENMDIVMLSLDECIDNGIILENDERLIVSRVNVKRSSDGGEGIQFNEQTLTNALLSARESLARSLLK